MEINKVDLELEAIEIETIDEKVVYGVTSTGCCKPSTKGN